MSGLPFWESREPDVQVDAGDTDEDEDSTTKKEKAQVPYSQQKDELEFRNKLAEQVVKKMAEEKKHKIQLITELDSLKEIFNGWSRKMTKQQL